MPGFSLLEVGATSSHAKIVREWPRLASSPTRVTQSQEASSQIGDAPKCPLSLRDPDRLQTVNRGHSHLGLVTALQTSGATEKSAPDFDDFTKEIVLGCVPTVDAMAFHNGR